MNRPDPAAEDDYAQAVAELIQQIEHDRLTTPAPEPKLASARRRRDPDEVPDAPTRWPRARTPWQVA